MQFTQPFAFVPAVSSDGEFIAYFDEDEPQKKRTSTAGY